MQKFIANKMQYYQMSRDGITSLQIKCHDLKHQLRALERVEDEGANEQAFEMTFGNQENSHITKSEKKTSGYEDKKREVVYRIMSQAARELSMKYDEVMVDEYQDSNLVQEMITTCVSGWAKKSKNIFMVGDVKQSIYRFRLARPELFMEKYKKYTLTDSEEQRIDLHKNFRSRSQVLSCANLFQADHGRGSGWNRV